MFKHSLSTAAILAALALASCSSDELAGVAVADGEETTVTIKAQLPGEMGSRAFSDGLSAKSLTYGVYEGEELKFTDTATFSNGLSTEVTLTLVAGKTYDILFWAAEPTATAYTLDWANQEVTVSYDGAVANDETRDAFYGKIVGLEAGKVSTAEATLTRPFAQVNVGTDDLAGYLKAEGEGASVKTMLVVTNAFTKLNLMSGAVDGAEAATFALAAPADAETFPVAHQTEGKSYSYMAMVYVLQGADDNTPNAKVDITFNDGAKDFNTVTVDNAPVRQNFRTNIYGSLLTTSVTATVTIDPIYTEPANNIYISTPQQLTAAFNKGGDYTLTEDITISTNLVAKAPLNLNLNNKTITAGTKQIAAYADVPVTLENGTVDSQLNGGTTGVFQVGQDSKPDALGKLTLKNFTLNAPAATGIAIHGKTELTLENVNINAFGYCIGTNGSEPNKQNLKVNVKGGKLASFAPIFVSVPIELTMTDVEIVGSTRGVIMRGGTANITGGKIVLDYSDSYTEETAQSDADWYNTVDWGTGSNVPVAALVLGNKTAKAYRYPTNVTLNGVEVTVNGKHASKFPAVSIWANPEEGNGVTFKYDAATTFGGKGIFQGNDGNNITIILPN